MRVISGTARGRRIVAPPGREVRPTSDRVRQATFNALMHRDAVEEAEVLDLFAGSGALGIEALSRGAKHVTFVESDRAAHSCILDNLNHLGFSDRATVFRSDAMRWVAAMRDPVDLVFADPPYQFDDWDPLLAAIRPRLAHEDAIVAMETGRVPVIDDSWTIVRQQRYGATVMTLVTGSGLADLPVDDTENSPPLSESFDA